MADQDLLPRWSFNRVTGDEPFARIEDVISAAEPRALSDCHLQWLMLAGDQAIADNALHMQCTRQGHENRFDSFPAG